MTEPAGRALGSRSISSLSLLDWVDGERGGGAAGVEVYRVSSFSLARARTFRTRTDMSMRRKKLCEIICDRLNWHNGKWEPEAEVQSEVR